jgi:hypothetical protein
LAFISDRAVLDRFSRAFRSLVDFGAVEHPVTITAAAAANNRVINFGNCIAASIRNEVSLIGGTSRFSWWRFKKSRQDAARQRPCPVRYKRGKKRDRAIFLLARAAILRNG